MSDIVWAINPKRETQLELTRRMRQHGARLDRKSEGSAWISAATLLLIFKEAVNNAARHSRCSDVEDGDGRYADLICPAPELAPT